MLPRGMRLCHYTIECANAQYRFIKIQSRASKFINGSSIFLSAQRLYRQIAQRIIWMFRKNV